MWVRSLGREDPLEESIAIQYSCLVNPYGQRCLAGYSPWSRKESNMTEQLSTAHTVGAQMSLLLAYYPSYWIK